MASMLKKSEGIESSRRRQRFNAHTSSYESSNRQTIRIDINSSEEYLDFQNGYLVYSLAVTGGGSNVGVPRYAATAPFVSMSVSDRAGNQIGEEVRDYAVLCRMLFEMNANLEAENSFLNELEGSDGVTPAANNAATLAARQYAHRIPTHIFGSANYFPAHLFGGITINIQYSNADWLIESGGATAEYTLSNVAYVCDMVKLRPEVEQMVLSSVQQGGLVVDYTTFHSTKANVSASASSFRADLGNLNGRVKNMQVVSIKSTDRTIDENGDFSRNNLSSYRFKIGSKFCSEAPIQCGAALQSEYLMEWLKSQKILCTENMLQFGNQVSLAGGALNSTKFVIGQGVDRSKTDAVLSSLKDKDSNRLELNLVYGSGGATEDQTIHCFTELDKRLVCLPGKQHIDNDFQGMGTSMV